ncbi:MAG: hypothetical protein ACI8Y4_000125 [Candidatus Poriferisodalaceae bacterium]|jgi:hypothetical protein
MIELRASIEERVDPTVNERVLEEIRSLRAGIDDIRNDSPHDVVTASRVRKFGVWGRLDR